MTNQLLPAPLVALILSLIGVLAPHRAAAWTYCSGGAKWPGGTFSYRANLASFSANIPGVSLSPGEFEWWIGAALSTWQERTGANLSLSYGGTTASGCNVDNLSNEVVASAACKEPGCTTWASTHTRVNGAGNLIEADVCVWGPSSDAWVVQAASVPAGSKDLIGTLTHEFGHALGLGHSALTTMDSETFQLGNTLARYPYGDDVAGIRSMYGPKVVVNRWKKYALGSWSDSTLVSGHATNGHPEAVAGRVAGSLKIAISWSGFSGSQVYFGKADEALGPQTVWSIGYVNSQTWGPPGLAARSAAGDSPVFLAAWIETATNLTTTPVRVLRSTDGFSSGTLQVMLTDSASHTPAVVWHPGSGRFILIYAARRFGNDVQNNDRLYARTSTDGISWTALQDLGIYSTDGPSLACASGPNGVCQMAYARASSDKPTPVARRFSVNSGSGLITLGPWEQGFSALQRRPGLTVRQEAGAPAWWLSMSEEGTISDMVAGTLNIWTTGDVDNPIDDFDFFWCGGSTQHASTVVSTREGGSLYMFYSGED